MKEDFYVVDVDDTDMVLGVQWLHSLGEYTTNYQTMELKFKHEGKRLCSRAFLEMGLWWFRQKAWSGLSIGIKWHGQRSA